MEPARNDVSKATSAGQSSSMLATSSLTAGHAQGGESRVAAAIIMTHRQHSGYPATATRRSAKFGMCQSGQADPTNNIRAGKISLVKSKPPPPPYHYLCFPLNIFLDVRVTTIVYIQLFPCPRRTIHLWGGDSPLLSSSYVCLQPHLCTLVQSFARGRDIWDTLTFTPTW